MHHIFAVVKCLMIFYLGLAKLKYFLESHQDCTSMPDLMLHFLEQAGDHSAQLKEKDDKIAQLRAEVENLKKSRQEELEKLDQEFSEEKNRMTLPLDKNKELLQVAEVRPSRPRTNLRGWTENKSSRCLTLPR